MWFWTFMFPAHFCSKRLFLQHTPLSRYIHFQFRFITVIFLTQHLDFSAVEDPRSEKQIEEDAKEEDEAEDAKEEDEAEDAKEDEAEA